MLCFFLYRYNISGVLVGPQLATVPFQPSEADILCSPALRKIDGHAATAVDARWRRTERTYTRQISTNVSSSFCYITMWSNSPELHINVFHRPVTSECPSVVGDVEINPDVMPPYQINTTDVQTGITTWTSHNSGATTGIELRAASHCFHTNGCPWRTGNWKNFIAECTQVSVYIAGNPTQTVIMAVPISTPYTLTWKSHPAIVTLLADNHGKPMTVYTKCAIDKNAVEAVQIARFV